MTAIATNSIYAPFAPFRIVGESDASKKLEEKIKNILIHFRSRSELQRAFSELILAFEQGEKNNWDQYRAARAKHRFYELASRFLNVLPSSTPFPEVGLDPDGEISFEWIVSRDKQFSVSLSPEGLLSYAGVFGSNSITHGTEQFDDQVPQTIISAVRRLGFRR